MPRLERPANNGAHAGGTARGSAESPSNALKKRFPKTTSSRSRKRGLAKAALANASREATMERRRDFATSIRHALIQLDLTCHVAIPAVELEALASELDDE